MKTENSTLELLAKLAEADPRVVNRVASRMVVSVRTVQRWISGPSVPSKAKQRQLQRILDGYKESA